MAFLTVAVDLMVSAAVIGSGGFRCAELISLSPSNVYSCRDACGGLHFSGGIGGRENLGGHVVAGTNLRAGMGDSVTATKFEDMELCRRSAQSV